MKCVPQWDQTNLSCNHSTTSLHNCPSCRCTNASFLKPRNARPSPLIPSHAPNASVSSAALQPPRNSIYLCQDYAVPRADRSSQLFRSHIMQTRSRGDHSETKSTSRNNITFTYISPSKKKHQSSDAKFSTKQFKLKHFPFLETRHQQCLKERPSDNPYYTTYNQQSPPKKHKILRLSKSKSQNKLKTISSKMSQRDSAFTVSQKGEAVQQKEEQKDEVERPRITPISALWQKPSHKENSYKHIAEAMRQTKMEVQRPSIQKIQFEKQVHSEAVSNEVGIPTNNTRLNNHFAQSNLTYSKPNPLISIQNLHYLTANFPQTTVITPQRARSENTLNAVESKLNFCKQKSVKLSLDVTRREDVELGEQLSEELQLNFDYYCPSIDYFIPKTQSDRSVSMSVSLC